MPPMTPAPDDRPARLRPQYWRSVEQWAGELPDAQPLPGESPAEAAQRFSASRRGFLKLMGASLGLAGLSGCIRYPEEKLAPESHRPANRTPGTPKGFATALELGGIGQGLLATSFDGRPIKIEGNPDHPLNQGAADAMAQASVLELYDTDRSRGVLRKDGDARAESSWDAFAAWAKKEFSGDGAGICVLSEASNSPSLADMRARLAKTLPKIEWFQYEPLSEDNAREGSRLAFGRPLRPVLELAQADVVVGLDADLFGGGNPLAVKYGRDFSQRRRLEDRATVAMSRLYVVESVHSVTGACADYRRALRPSAVSAAVAQLAAALEVPGVEPPKDRLTDADQGFLKKIVADLKAHAGNSVVVAGPRQPPDVHALVAAINQKLGNVGRTVVYFADPEPDRPTHTAAIGTLVRKMKAGEVRTLVILGGNPAFNAPAELKFAEALTKVPNSIHLALHDDETSQFCTWHVSRAHYLETWGDVRAHDGTISVAQPLIEPLFDGRSVIELLAILSGDQKGIEGGGQQIVRRTAQSLLGEAFSDWAWIKILAEGIVRDTAWKAAAAEELPRATVPKIINSPARTGKDYELVLLADSKVFDGRFANNGWLQEMPDPMTRLTWDNAALMSPKTAESLGVRRDELVVLEALSGQQVRAPVLMLPGMAEGVIGLALGYGRQAAGNVGNGVGHNAYLLRTSDAMGWVNVKARATGESYTLATVQDHHVIDTVGKEAIQERIPKLVIEGTLDQYRSDPSLGIKKTALPSIFNEHKFDGRVGGHANEDSSGLPPHRFHKWGMIIDLGACTGCGACVVACQAENNIPIVGKEQVYHGREMHWIRVDRYFRETPDEPVAVHQPVPCMQCENAPCESVCPVAATTHSEEGLNMMTYNRCLGVRYCSNNCPYKVRRFNFFDYNRGTLQNLYEPNLARSELSELARMQKNPDVTVRMRGVMEKCTYCVQRIEQARILAAREGGRPIRDGEIQTACQQSCPARAIVFGDLNDPASRIAQLYQQARAYGLLDDYLNTKPRTRYLARVRNRAEGLGTGD